MEENVLIDGVLEEIVYKLQATSDARMSVVSKVVHIGHNNLQLEASGLASDLQVRNWTRIGGCKIF